MVNGLPLVHIELKKRGVSLHEAFSQIDRYGKESFNAENSLYKFVQIFVISNGTYTRYFANTTAQNKNHYEFTCEWADAKNKVIRDLKDFTATFFEKRTILEVLTKYCVFDSNNTLLIMRPYQIAATERILWKIESSYQNKKCGKIEAGGFIWHTTGLGKTLTSFKTAKLYYEEFQKQQENLPEEKRLKVATIYSFAANEERNAIGDIPDENFEPSAMESTAKEFLDKVISDYNDYFKTNFSTNGNEFQNYYKDLSKKVKDKKIDILIVVGMFLTGFDAPTLNTLFVDKNLRYHGLIQAFSRTNRILNKVKTFGNIVCFRDLEKATKNAIKTFGDENSVNIILEKSYNDYIKGFKDEETGKSVKGYIDLCNEIVKKFPKPVEIEKNQDKKEFAELFGELLKTENILKNFDEFENFEKIISDRQMQDMKSVYVDICEEIRNAGKDDQNNSNEQGIDFSDIEFQIDLLKTDEINLDYILELILEKTKEHDDIETLKSEIRRIIRTSLGTRAKENLVINFINKTDLKKLKNNGEILDAFY